MAIKIKSTRDVVVDGVKCVIYGESGVGKTVLCSTAPTPIILSAEHGLLSLADQDVPFIEVKTIEQIGEAFKYCKDSDFETICLDSLSEITEAVLAEFKTQVADGRQAYMKLSESVGNMIRNFRDLKGKNVIFVAKQKRIEDEDTGIVTYEPFLPGKVLPFNLPYLVDELFCMRISPKGERYIQTSADRKYPCKDRSGVLEAKEQPDLTAIINKIINRKSTKDESNGTIT